VYTCTNVTTGSFTSIARPCLSTSSLTSTAGSGYATSLSDSCKDVGISYVNSQRNITCGPCSSPSSGSSRTSSCLCTLRNIDSLLFKTLYLLL
jgi:hypothetical protein